MDVVSSEPLREPRAITDDEVAFYRKHGWVRLNQLIDRETCAALLARVKQRFAQGSAGLEIPAFTVMLDLSDEDPTFRAFSRSKGMARVASRLIGRPVRPFFDSTVVKLPASETGGETQWHQDSPYYPFDRTGTLNIWIPLVDCPPEKGSMRFISGSHRLGPLGRTTVTGENPLELNPWILDEFEMSPPLDLAAGDATVVDHAVIHYAPPNETDTPRWVYTAMFFPAETLYIGAPHRRTDGLGLVVNEPLAHDRFPVLAT